MPAAAAGAPSASIVIAAAAAMTRNVRFLRVMDNFSFSDSDGLAEED